MIQSQFQTLPKCMLSLSFVLICLSVTGWAQINELTKKGGETYQVTFKDVPMKSLIGTFGKEMGLEVIIDDSVPDAKVSVDMQDVTIEAALKAILAQQHLQARLMSARTMVIFPDAESARQRFAGYAIWPDKLVEQSKDNDGAVQTVIFRGASVKSVLSTLGKQLNLNVVYDNTVKDSRVNLELKDSTIKAAMKVVLVQQQLQARLIEDKTIIIFPDTESNRKRYEQYKVWPDEAGKQ